MIARSFAESGSWSRAEGCCTCFENKRKLVYTNGNPAPSDQTDQSKNNELVPLLVKRRR